MSILIADPGYGLALAPDGGAPVQPVSCPAISPYLPWGGPEGCFVCCRQSGDCWLLRKKSLEPCLRFPAPPALAALRCSPCGRFLYQLSTEADAVHTIHLGTGELCFAAPVGVFPRSMNLTPNGRKLLVAGGAVDEAYLLRTPELTRERVFATRGPCFGADFWRGGLLLVCAEEGEDIQTTVSVLEPGKARPRELLRLPGQPGGLCVCPDGATALLSTPAGLTKLHIPSGRLLWNLPQWPLTMKLCCRGGMALISETLTGQVCLLGHEQPWRSRILFSGTDAQACFIA